MNAMQEFGRKFTHITVLAFGTLGDVLPVAAVTARVATIQEGCNITFITHSAHEFLRRPLALSGIKFHPVSTAPVSLPPGDACVPDKKDDMPEPGGFSGGESSTRGVSRVETWRSSVDKQHRQECLSAVDQIFGPEQEKGSGLIIFNFFALEGWHLAELYRVPCAVVAPYVVPYSFGQYNPCFTGDFREPSLERLDGLKLFIGCGRYLQVVGHLGALTDPVTELPVSQDWPRAPPLLYGFSPEVVECPEYWPTSIHVCGFWYPPAEWEGLLSEDIESKGGPILRADIGSVAPFKQNLLEFLSDMDSLPVYIGLSSIGSMGYLKDPEIFLKVILTVLEAANKRAILHTASYSPLDSAVKRMLSEKSSKTRKMKDNLGSDNQQHDIDRLEDGALLGRDRLFCYSQRVSHNWLFPQLSAIIHHGGSGTTAAALRSGIPQVTTARAFRSVMPQVMTGAALRSEISQVICPFLLDQFYWAERMAWIGVAPDPLKPSHLFPEGDEEFEEAVIILQSSVANACSTSMRHRAAALSCNIRQEDGTATFVRTLLEGLSLA